jgi:hypothetical protein
VHGEPSTTSAKKVYERLGIFEQVLCGGYVFVPPHEHANEPGSWVVPAAD